MHAITATIIAALSAGLVFTIIYSSLYFQNRERYMGFWAAFGGASLVGLGFSLAVFTLDLPPVLNLAYPICEICGSLLLLWGTHEFAGRPLSRWWFHAAALAVVLSVVAALLTAPFTVLALPSGIFAAGALVASGRLFFRLEEPGFGKKMAAWACFLWALHAADYPFLGEYTWAIPWGFLIGTTFAFMVTTGILVVYFQRKESRFRGLAESSRKAEAALRIAEYEKTLILNSISESVCYYDTDLRILWCNRALTERWDLAAEQLAGRLCYEVKYERTEACTGCPVAAALATGEFHENEITSRAGRTRLIRAYPVRDANGVIVGAVDVTSDITERKQAEERLRQLGLHDPLTGLANRARFEHEMRALGANPGASAGLILCDIDGLKFINDTFGHEKGDRLLQAAADIIRGVFRGTDVVARVGGDEFAVLFSNTSAKAVEKAFQRIRELVENHNRANPDLPLSLSIGYATTHEAGGVKELFKEADTRMYREKQHRSGIVRSSIVETLVKALEAREAINGHHAEKMRHLVAVFGRALGLSEKRISELRLLAHFHDIGNVGVPGRILFNPGPLTLEERVEMQRHAEIGYRIALTASDLVPIADWILKHHEWWNGKGYPLGLKGEDIPLECRILGIVDAYDAMTSDRPHRGALTHEEALDELRRWAGVQFDPGLVEVFCGHFNRVEYLGGAV
jgi:diguanylate cyclase (GGDEF)-like protein/PAS domain S-box-containing protein